MAGMFPGMNGEMPDHRLHSEWFFAASQLRGGG